MTLTPRPGFDGGYLNEPERGLLWLIMGGRRHHIHPEAAAAVFRDDVRPAPAPDFLDSIPIGGTIREGSRLVMSDETRTRHLYVVGVPDHRLHLIVSYASFIEYGFGLDKVLAAPEALLRTVPVGAPLVGARDRLAREGHAMYLPLLEILR